MTGTRIDPDTAGQVGAGLSAVRERIQIAEQRFGREPGSVGLIAVSKRQAADKLVAAHMAGQQAFGESYLQEALDKQEALAGLDLEWHFIGRLQSNKTRPIAERFDWVHGLASREHAKRLGAQRPSGLGPLRVCIQVNLSGETSKAGVAPDELDEFVADVSRVPGLRLMGLMTLPAPAQEFAAQRRPFAMLRELRDRLATPERPLPVLSMGMSQDLEAAIAEGATIVRVGTAVFGERSPP